MQQTQTEAEAETKVWVVRSSFYEDWFIEGIFSSEDKAIAYRDKFMHKYEDVVVTHQQFILDKEFV